MVDNRYTYLLSVTQTYQNVILKLLSNLDQQQREVNKLKAEIEKILEPLNITIAAINLTEDTKHTNE